MKTKPLIVGIIVVVLVIVGAAMYMNRSADTTQEPDSVNNTGSSMKDLIVVDVPKVNSVITSPLTIAGKARGTWYFEASFPVRLEDANGIVLAEAPAQAVGEWMTEDFVLFNTKLTFKNPSSATGVLILKNDNPSGDPARDKEVRVPVRFSGNGSTTQGTFGAGIKFSVGTKVNFPGGLDVFLTAIDDSRCKPDVQCIWQGELAAVLSVGTPGNMTEIRLGTVNNRILKAKGYTFTLQDATVANATILVTK